MKKILGIALSFCCSLSAFAQEHFNLSGKLEQAPVDGKVAIIYNLPNGDQQVDSCKLNNGTFSFSGTYSGSQMVYMTSYTGKFDIKSDDQPNVTNFFVDPGKVVITGTFGQLKSIKVTGSPSQEQFAALEAKKDVIKAEAGPLMSAYGGLEQSLAAAKKDSTKKMLQDSLAKKIENIGAQMQKLEARYTSTTVNFIKANPDSYVSAFQLMLCSSALPLDSLTSYYDRFTPRVKRTIYAKRIATNIAATKASATGKPAYQFSTTDINGKPIALADFKGKYVLLDFWASWCVPCRKSTPHLLNVYKKYHKKGMEVIAVADNDSTPKDWRKAVAADGTSIWHNVLRGMIVTDKGMNVDNSISDKYAVSVLPTKILIDPNGMVIGRYGGTEDAAALDKKLSEVMGD